MAKRIPNGAYKTEAAARRACPIADGFATYQTMYGYGWTRIGSSHYEGLLAGTEPPDERLCKVYIADPGGQV